ncbi:MAG TPA: SH3 domain-containing protein [Firmicutes bacterium]|nr:SH3 domain-containing protein [Bacillota bacterium]
MNQGIIAALLSILFYLTNLLGGGQSQPIQPMDPPLTQQSYVVLGQTGKVTADRVTVRRSPAVDGIPLGTVTRNTTITVLDKMESWYKIRPRIGTEGWVPDYAVSIEEVQREDPKKVILGFYPGGEMAYDSLLENSETLTSIAPLGWKLDSYGGLVTDFDPEEMGRSLFFAGNQEMVTYATVEIAANPSRLLATENLKVNSINRIIATLEEWGLKGVLVDITYVPKEEQVQLFEYLRTLRARLREEGFKTLIGLPWDDSIDYEAASHVADYIVLGTARPSQSEPGPVASIRHVEDMLEKTIAQVPTERIILALSPGGLHWSRSDLATPLSHKEVLELAAREGASVRWDTESKTPYFGYGAGREVWFENRYSMKYKLDLVDQYNLGGMALRNLGQEDSDIWSRL